MKNKKSFLEKLPNPVSIVVFGTILIIILSILFQNRSFTYFDANKNIEQSLTTINLTSRNGFSFMFNSISMNFVMFQPIWLGVFAIISFALFEASEFSRTLLLFLRRYIDIKTVSFCLVFLGILSSAYINAGYIILLPLACYIYYGYGHSIIAGVIPTLIGVSCGFTVNLFRSVSDTTFLTLSNNIFTKFQFTYDFRVDGNFYFFLAYTIIVTAFFGFYTNKFLLEKNIQRNLEVASLTKEEQFAFSGAVIILTVYTFFFTYLLYTKPAFFQQNFNGAENNIQFFKEFGFSYVFLVGMSLVSLGHGFFLGTFKSDSTVIKKTLQQMNKFTYFYLLAFLFAQMVNFYQYSNLDKYVVFLISNFVIGLGFKNIFLVIVILIASFIMNIFSVSASIKWGIFGPLLMPLMYAQGFSFEFTTLIYRIGESTSNVMSPFLIYIPFILALIFKFDDEIKLSEIVKPIYKATFILLIIVIILVTIFYTFNIPIGEGVLPKI